MRYPVKLKNGQTIYVEANSPDEARQKAPAAWAEARQKGIDPVAPPAGGDPAHSEFLTQAGRQLAGEAYGTMEAGAAAARRVTGGRVGTSIPWGDQQRSTFGPAEWLRRQAEETPGPSDLPGWAGAAAAGILPQAYASPETTIPMAAERAAARFLPRLAAQRVGGAIGRYVARPATTGAVGGAIQGAGSDPDNPLAGAVGGALGGATLGHLSSPLQRIATKAQAQEAAARQFATDYLVRHVHESFGGRITREVAALPPDANLRQRLEATRAGIGNIQNTIHSRMGILPSQNPTFEAGYMRAQRQAAQDLEAASDQEFTNRVNRIAERKGLRRSNPTFGPTGQHVGFNFTYHDVHGRDYAELLREIRREGERIGSGAHMLPDREERYRRADAYRNFAQSLENMGTSGDPVADQILRGHMDNANDAYARLMRYGDVHDTATGLAAPKDILDADRARRGTSGHIGTPWGSPRRNHMEWLAAQHAAIRDAQIPLGQRGRRRLGQLGRHAAALGGAGMIGAGLHAVGASAAESGLGGLGGAMMLWPTLSALRDPESYSLLADLARRYGGQEVKRAVATAPGPIGGFLGGHTTRGAGNLGITSNTTGQFFPYAFPGAPSDQAPAPAAPAPPTADQTTKEELVDPNDSDPVPRQDRYTPAFQ